MERRPKLTSPGTTKHYKYPRDRDDGIYSYSNVPKVMKRAKGCIKHSKNVLKAITMRGTSNNIKPDISGRRGSKARQSRSVAWQAARQVGTYHIRQEGAWEAGYGSRSVGTGGRMLISHAGD